MRASNANVAKIKQTVSRHRSARIVSIALVQVLVMVAVLIAALYHINWSSNAALAEFLSTASNQCRNRRS
jgi:hypothetical protein